MKKIILLLVVAIIFSCKNSKQKEQPQDIFETQSVSDSILSTVSLPSIDNWGRNNIEFTSSQETHPMGPVSTISRVSKNESAYVSIDNLPVYSGSTYRLSVVVKKFKNDKNFALRFQGIYPNRVDAVYDLETGIVKEVLLSGADGMAQDQIATIEHLGGGWYMCSLSANLFNDYVRVVMGPTTNKLKTGLWETRTGKKSNALIVANSLKLDEL